MLTRLLVVILMKPIFFWFIMT